MLHVGDITKLDGAKLPPVDIITGGSPCQDLSVAGKRAGLAGERSGLFMEQVRIIREMRIADKARQSSKRTDEPVYIRPRYMVWENVPGAFSSAGGEDFRAVLEETCKIVDGALSIPRPATRRWESAGAILGDGFSVAWRVLDAQYWGVPQRRRRIFLVADFGGSTASKVLFEQESLPWNFAAGAGERQGASAAAPGSIGVASRADGGGTGEAVAYAANQWDEVRNLHDVAATIAAQPGMKQQTFVSQMSAGFCAGSAPTAGGIGYQEECAPTLKAAESGTNMVPSVLCLNDQGGSFMTTDVNISGTLRAQMDGHPPLIQQNNPTLYENHGIDSRYTGPLETAPTMSARYGTGGNNVPLVSQEPDSYCIAGNIIDREPKNGGNGIGYQADISYTLNTADRHVVFNRQCVDKFNEDELASTESARQYKDATDLVMDVAGIDCRNGLENGDVCATLQPGNSGTSLNSVHPVRAGQTIRRLTPLECERLQGFPDGWTALEKASDSARYKALGNSVAIPCVDFVLRGIAFFASIERV